MRKSTTITKSKLAWVCLAAVFLLILTGCGEDQISTVTPAELAACMPTNQTAVEARVVHVADGDTITVEIDGQDYRLRYIGINAPELDSQYQKELARQSTEFNSQLVADRTVTLYRDTSETDQYDRLLRYVWTEDTFVNYEIVRRGLARAKDYPPDSACKAALAEAENLARAENLGIWAGD